MTAANGTWAGSTPVTYTYAWSRCDQDGGSCSKISGASANTFVLKKVDTGTTLRVTVTRRTPTAPPMQPVPTPVVAATPPPVSNGCPTGAGTIAIADLASPARLAIDQQAITPGIVMPSTGTIQAHFRVTACGGRPVQGALVYATAVPYNQYSIAPEGTTGADGGTTLTMNQLRGFPAARQQQLLVVFVRARKAGEILTGGISTRLLVSFRVALK